MLNKTTFYTVILLSFTLIASCKKYEENPLINLWPKKHRLTATTGYVVTSFMVNGADSTHSVPSIGMITFLEDEHQHVLHTAYFSGEWNFYDKKKYLQIYAYPNTAGHQYGVLLAPLKLNWRILKLTDRELHLKIDFRGKNYVLHLNKME